jgi:hypothetical protein
VVDQSTGRGLADAAVWVRARRGRVHTWEGRTDSEGRYLVKAPGEATRSFDIFVAAAGFAPASVVTSAGGVPKYAVPLRRAETIGGVVRDDAGRPIAAARVLATPFPALVYWQEILASSKSGLAIATTDENGRWKSESLPVGTDADARVNVIVMHPDYLTAGFPTTAKDARAHSSVQVLKAGLAVFGTVVSPFERPVRGATITILIPRSSGMFVQLTTDEDGRFRSGRFLDRAGAGFELMVGATGLATTFHYVETKAASAPQVIKLTRRRPLAGRVVDAQGKPVAGAVVACREAVSYGPLGWETETDVNGRFEWRDAPTSGSVFLRAFKPGFRNAGRSTIRPETSGVAITLHEQ